MGNQIKIEKIIDAKSTADGKSVSLHVRLRGGCEACLLLDIQTALFLNPKAHQELANLPPVGSHTDKQQNASIAYKPRKVSISYSLDEKIAVFHFDDDVPTQQQYVLSEDQFLDLARDMKDVLSAIHGGPDKLN